MAKAKKAAKKGAKDTAGLAEGGAPEGEVKSPSKLGAIAIPLVAFIAAGGASFAMTATPPPPAPIIIDDEAPKPLTWSPPQPEKTVAIEPILVSLGEPGQVLKLGLAIELADGNVEPDTPRLRDAFTGYVRTIGPQALADPNFHSQLKRQLLHRARVVLGPNTVTDVLITDFMITR